MCPTRWVKTRLCRRIFAPSAIPLSSSSGEADPPCPTLREEPIASTTAMLAPINKNKQRARLNRDVLDVRSGFVIIGADATAFYPEGDTAVNVFRASIRVAHASSRAGDGVLAIADFSYGAQSRVHCGVLQESSFRPRRRCNGCKGTARFFNQHAGHMHHPIICARRTKSSQTVSRVHESRITDH